MQAASIRRAAELVGRARLARVPFGGLPDDCRPDGERDGYLVQRAVHEYLGRHGRGRFAGYKIGCTTTVMQEYLRIGSPCAGGILDASVAFGSGRFALADHVCPGVECEIAVRLGRDLTPDHAPFTREKVAHAVESCLAAIEVVDNRYTDFTGLGAPTLIADDFFGAGCVLGSDCPRFNPYDLATVTAHMEVNGVNVGQGTGADVLGDPLDALVWLADTVAGAGGRLAAGQFVLLGSVVKTYWLESASEVVAFNTPLGNVSATFV